MVSVLQRARHWGSLIRFSHSVFALPFALIMMLVLGRVYPITWIQMGLLTTCVVAARTAAMTFNRIVDREYDARNARTQGRELPVGTVSLWEAWGMWGISVGVFLLASFGLGVHCGVLAVPVLAVLLGYSYVKRFSTLCHFVLGLSLALAPGGVWYAITATWSWNPVPLMVAVLLWVAGFDILYACQDVEFDRANGLWSVPSCLGLARSRALAFVSHAGAIAALAVFGVVFDLGSFFWWGVALFAALIISQHVAVARHGLACIDQVFFNRNGVGSVLLFVFVALDVL